MKHHKSEFEPESPFKDLYDNWEQAQMIRGNEDQIFRIHYGNFIRALRMTIYFSAAFLFICGVISAEYREIATVLCGLALGTAIVIGNLLAWEKEGGGVSIFDPPVNTGATVTNAEIERLQYTMVQDLYKAHKLDPSFSKEMLNNLSLERRAELRPYAEALYGRENCQFMND